MRQASAVARSEAVCDEAPGNAHAPAGGARASGSAIVLAWQLDEAGRPGAAQPRGGTAARRWLLLPALAFLACGGTALLYAAGSPPAAVAPSGLIDARASEDVVAPLLPGSAVAATPAAKETMTIEPDVPAAAILPTSRQLVSPVITGSIERPAGNTADRDVTVQSGLSETSGGGGVDSIESAAPVTRPRAARSVLGRPARPRAATAVRNTKWTGTFFNN